MAEQSRAARGLLGWSQADLAERAGVSESTVRNFEKGRSGLYARNAEAIRQALEDAGVVFIENDAAMGPGVRMSKPVPRR